MHVFNVLQDDTSSIDDNQGQHPSYGDCAADEATMARLENMCSIDDDVFQNEAMSSVAGIVSCSAVPHRTPLPDAVARRQTSEDAAGLLQATRQLQDKHMKTVFSKPIQPDNRTTTRALHIDRDVNGTAHQSRVMILDSTSPDPSTETVIPRGQSPPYVLVLDRDKHLLTRWLYMACASSKRMPFVSSCTLRKAGVVSHDLGAILTALQSS